MFPSMSHFVATEMKNDPKKVSKELQNLCRPEANYHGHKDAVTNSPCILQKTTQEKIQMPAQSPPPMPNTYVCYIDLYVTHIHVKCDVEK